MTAPRNAAEIPAEIGKGNIIGFTVSHPNDLTSQNTLKRTLEPRILGANSDTPTIPLIPVNALESFILFRTTSPFKWPVRGLKLKDGGLGYNLAGKSWSSQKKLS